MAAYTFTWVILNESLEWYIIAVGLCLSLVVLFFTDTHLLMNSYSRAYQLRPLVLLKYLVLLIIQIYKSGFSVIRRIIAGKDDVCIIEHPSYLEDGLSQILLANAITLTPGTVTLDIVENKLIILSLNDNHEQQVKQPDISVKKIEIVLRGKA